MAGRRFGHERQNKRYKDVNDFGPSFLLPFNPKEPWNVRHKRRHRLALENADRLQKFCAYYKIEFGILDDLPNKHHFWFYDKLTFVAYHWYPSSAKFVIEPSWKFGYHVHDHLQVMNFLMIARKQLTGFYDPNKFTQPNNQS